LGLGVGVGVLPAFEAAKLLLKAFTALLDSFFSTVTSQKTILLS